MTLLHANGLDFHTKQLGNGRPLFMLHGLLVGNLASWYLVSSRLSRRHRLILYDLRGHGKSEIPASGYTLESMVSDLAALADTLSPSEMFDLAGFSYGGLVALKFALAHPDRVNRLVLVEATLPPLGGAVDRYLNADVASLLEEIPQSARAALMTSPRLLTGMAKRAQRLIGETTLIADARSEARLDRQELRALHVPTLLVYGSNSAFVDDGRFLAETLGQAELRVMTGTHWLLLENAPAILGHIEAFLDAT